MKRPKKSKVNLSPDSEQTNCNKGASGSRRSVELLYKGPVTGLDEKQIYDQSFGRMTPGERCIATWELVETAWKMKGRNPSELRLQRSVMLLKRS